MSDAELRDQAVAELRQTTRGLKGYTPVAGSHWANALGYLGQIGGPTPPPPPPPPPPTSGAVLFNSDFESGTLIPPWAGEHTTVSSGVDQHSPRLSIVASDAGVTPRKGSRFGRFEVRKGELSPWGYYNTALLQAGQVAGANALGDDVYTGFSLYLPDGFPYVGKAGEANVYANSIIEWHSPPPMSQAPIHFFLDGSQGGAFSLDIHTDPSVYNPKPVWGGLKFGPLVTGRWVDFVFRVKWAKDASGMIEGWQDGQHKFAQNLPTWGSATASPYLEAGYYRDDIAPTAVLYLDELKVGTTYSAVAP